jgi:hypothetical protein
MDTFLGVKEYIESEFYKTYKYHPKWSVVRDGLFLREKDGAITLYYNLNIDVLGLISSYEYSTFKKIEDVALSMIKNAKAYEGNVCILPYNTTPLQKIKTNNHQQMETFLAMKFSIENEFYKIYKSLAQWSVVRDGFILREKSAVITLDFNLKVNVLGETSSYEYSTFKKIEDVVINNRNDGTLPNNTTTSQSTTTTNQNTTTTNQNTTTTNQNTTTSQNTSTSQNTTTTNQNTTTSQNTSTSQNTTSNNVIMEEYGDNESDNVKAKKRQREVLENGVDKVLQNEFDNGVKQLLKNANEINVASVKMLKETKKILSDTIENNKLYLAEIETLKRELRESEYKLKNHIDSRKNSESWGNDYKR